MTNLGASDHSRSPKTVTGASGHASSKAARVAREQKQLPENLSRRLSTYAAAALHNPRLSTYASAAAIGVGLLGLAPVAEADIIFTPASIGISVSSAFRVVQFPIGFAGNIQLTFSAARVLGVSCLSGPLCVSDKLLGVQPLQGTPLPSDPCLAAVK